MLGSNSHRSRCSRPRRPRHSRPPRLRRPTTIPLPQGACATQRARSGWRYLPGVNCRVARVDGYPRRFVVSTFRAAGLSFRARSCRADVPRQLRDRGAVPASTSGWREQADATGLIAVFLETGVRYRVLDSGRRSTKWNAFGLDAQVGPELPPGYPSTSPCAGLTTSASSTGIVGDLDARLPIDDHRVYASGFSNGAYEFTARLGRRALDPPRPRSRTRPAACSPHSRPHGSIPMFATLGSLDDRGARADGAAAAHRAPARPAGILTSPILDPFIDAHLATLGLDDRPFGAIARRRLHGSALASPGQRGRRRRVPVRDAHRTNHHYPNGRRSAAGHDGCRRFWRFFEQHPLP